MTLTLILVAVAVAFVIGAAFKALVDAFVGAIMMPLVGAIFGKPSFDALTVKVGDGVVAYGLFINAVINFLFTAVAIFMLVKAMNEMKKRMEKEKPEFFEENNINKRLMVANLTNNMCLAHTKYKSKVFRDTTVKIKEKEHLNE